MKAIKFSMNDKNKQIKKFLINRSRSNNFASICNRQDCDSPKFKAKLPKNINECKNSGQASIVSKQDKLKQDQYLLHYKKEGEESKHRTTKESKGYLKNDYFTKNQLKNPSSVIKQIQEVIETKNDKKNIQEDKTTHSSKFSRDGKQLIQCQYFNKGYQSPKLRLRHLQKQRNFQKQKYLSIIEKMVSTEEQIQQNRNKIKIQSEIYENVILNLKRQNKSVKSSSCFQLCCDSILKQSGNYETEVGESSNQYQNFPNSLTNSCQI